MPYKEGITPLANLCQKAGSTLDDVLSLDEQELEELSKEICGNGVLEHARVVRQWRRCRMEEDLRRELQVELNNEGQGVEVPLALTREDRQQVQKKTRFAGNDVREIPVKDNRLPPEQQQHQQQDVIGESWEQYLRKQIKKEMFDTTPPPVSNVKIKSAAQAMTSGFTEEESDDDYETFVESLTIDPSLESSDEDEDEDVRTTYNPMNPIGAVASDMMGLLEDGISAFFEPELPKKKKKKPKSKSLLETGMDYLYPEPEREKSAGNKKEKTMSPEDGLCVFFNDSSKENNNRSRKENNNRSSKVKKKKKKSTSFNKWMKSKEPVQPPPPPGPSYKLVQTHSLQARHKFHC